MEKNGWIKLHRKILNNPISNKPNYAWLWITLLLKANHKENKVIWNGNILIIKKGQILTGRKELSKQTGISESTLEDILKYLEKQQQIRQQKTTKFRVITIVKWEDYQKPDTKSDNKATTKQQQSDTNNNDKNDKNDKNIHSEQSSQVKQVMDIFYKTNPTLNFGNKTIRKACIDLINLMGIEKALEVSAFAVSVQNKQFYPVITNPYQLWIRLSDLKIAYERDKNGGAINLDNYL